MHDRLGDELGAAALDVVDPVDAHHDPAASGHPTEAIAQSVAAVATCSANVACTSSAEGAQQGAKTRHSVATGRFLKIERTAELLAALAPLVCTT